MAKSTESKNWHHYCKLSFAVVFAMVLSTSVVLAENPSPAYLFKQKSEVQGNVELLVSPLGAKLSLLDRHLAIFMRAPLWRVQYCDTRTKHYYECDREGFREPLARTISMTKPSSPTHLKLRSSKVITFMGIPARQFDMFDPNAAESRKIETWQGLGVRSGIAKGYEEGPAKLYGRVLCRALVLPELDAVPLANLVTNYRSESFSDFETVSLKKVTATAADFAVPSGWTKVTTDTAVAAENKVDSSLGDLFK